MTNRCGAIPVYALSGEADGPWAAGFVHIETIAERSSLHGWEIAPHRHHHSLQLLIVQEGVVDILLDGARRQLAGPCHAAIPAGRLHGFRFEPGTHGHVLTFPLEFAGRASGPEDPLRRLFSQGAIGPIGTAAARRILWLAEEMLALARDIPAPGALLPALAESLVRSLPDLSGPAGQRRDDDDRLARFRLLIETHLRESRPVSFYAEALGVTERTLTRLCNRRLGLTPLELINRRRAMEAQRLLRFTNATVTQAATELGFPDPSYFSRFYQRMTGRRPNTERGLS